jgi:hypothetical protein
MATVPVLSSRGLDHDSVFKSGELFPARDVCPGLEFLYKLKVIIGFKLLEH